MPKNVFWFKHDTNASDDPKIKALRKQYGWEGFGWYWHIIEMMCNEENYQLEYSPLVIDALADDFRCDSSKVESYINSCIDTYQLFTKNTTHFYSLRLWRDMERVNNTKEQRALAGKLSAQKRLNTNTQQMLNTSSTNAEQMLNTSSTVVQQIDREDKIDREDIVVTGKKLKKFPPSQIPLVKTVFKGLQEQRGYNTTQPAAEALAINQMIKDGLTPEQILKAHALIKKQPFYQDKAVSMMYVRKNIHEVLNNGTNRENSQGDKPEEDYIAKYTKGKYGKMVRHD